MGFLKACADSIKDYVSRIFGARRKGVLGSYLIATVHAKFRSTIMTGLEYGTNANDHEESCAVERTDRAGSNFWHRESALFDVCIRVRVLVTHARNTRGSCAKGKAEKERRERHGKEVPRSTGSG